jgi:SAM-dependent methyltransferase
LSSFNDMYRGIPPWDIGRPQPEFVRVAESGEVVGDVIDVGCGTGEHALLFASKGYRTLGVDSAPLAIEKAKAKASQRGSKAEFQVADALRLSALGRKFGTAIDSGLFHVFPDAERDKYLASLASVLTPGSKLFMLCFSDREPTDWGGPRRISKEEILDCFSVGWRVDQIHTARFASMFHDKGGKAWMSKITRT